VGSRKSSIAVIPARGGSKGLPGKNLRNLMGKPLIAWTIEAALRSGCFDRVIVSTDSGEIAEESLRWGAEVPFLRPEKLAGDNSPTVDAVLHLADELGIEDDVWLCLLQPTSPLRDDEDIRRALESIRASDADSGLSVCRFKLDPKWLMPMGGGNVLQPPSGVASATRRQDAERRFYPNGAIYWSLVGGIRRRTSMVGDTPVGYPMPFWKSIDIDEIDDFIVAEHLMGTLFKRNRERRGNADREKRQA